MAITKMQVSAMFDTAFARDRMVNTLYFEDLGTSDWDGNCEDLANIFQTSWYDNGAREIQVRAYDAEGAAPHFPKGEYVKNPGTVGPPSSCPREVALCLSFYATRNLPRQRGRIYLPIAGTSHNPALRPNPTIMNKALALGGFFAALGGADVSWNVWSPTDSQGREVTNTWVDDEWDTQRSRGLRASTRVLGSPGSQLVALTRFEGVRMPRWVAAELRRGRRHGWTGRAVSGYRTDAEQLAAAKRFADGRGVTVASLYPNGPLASNHCGTAWPRGAVDVTRARELRGALDRAGRPWLGRRLVWAVSVGFNDDVHFSRTGH